MKPKRPAASQVEPTAFQAEAMKRLAEVLRKHKILFSDFSVNRGAKTAFFTSFTFAGEEHLLAIYDDEINMTQGPNLFESYMPNEFKSGATLIEGFETRLNRYLGGGCWEDPAEKGLADFIKEKVKYLLRR